MSDGKAAECIEKRLAVTESGFNRPFLNNAHCSTRDKSANGGKINSNKKNAKRANYEICFLHVLALLTTSPFVLALQYFLRLFIFTLTTLRAFTGESFINFNYDNRNMLRQQKQQCCLRESI